MVIYKNSICQLIYNKRDILQNQQYIKKVRGTWMWGPGVGPSRWMSMHQGFKLKMRLFLIPILMFLKPYFERQNQFLRQPYLKVHHR